MPKPIPTQEGLQPDGTTWKMIDGKMRLIDRRPEWPEQDKQDREAYGLPQNESLAINVWLEMNPEESREHAFRRGHADGWLHALETMADLLVDEELTFKEAYYAMMQFAKRGAMRQWVDGDCRVESPAPSIGTISLGKEIRAKRNQKEEGDGDGD